MITTSNGVVFKSKEEVQARVNFLKQKIQELDSFQYAVKIIINQVYGAFGNQHFYFNNNDIAESITLQGQDLIKYSIFACNGYFRNFWHSDTELHTKLGISGHVIHRVDEDVVIYVDTDSNYLRFDIVIDSIEGLVLDKQGKLQLVLDIIKNKFASFLVDSFENYADSFGTTNRMVFKLENISDCGIWVAKKMYVYREMYEGFFHAPKVKAKGLPCTKPSHPKMAREILWKLIDVMLDVNKGIVLEKHIIPLLREMYEKYKLSDVDNIGYNVNVNNINKYALLKSQYDVVEQMVDGKQINCAIDKTTKEVFKVATKKKGESIADIQGELGNYYLVKGVNLNVKGCLRYNNLIIDSGVTKYNKIKSGDKVKMYYISGDDNSIESFCYMSGQYDSELNHPVDYEMNFFKSVVTPANALLSAIGKQTLTCKLKRDISIKIPKTNKKNSGVDVLPFYIVNSETLENYALPNHIVKYITTDKDIPDYLIDEYDSIISPYGDDAVVMSHVDLDKYIRTRTAYFDKRANAEILAKLDVVQRKHYADAISALKKHFKFKVDYDSLTKDTIIYKKGSDVRLRITLDDMLSMKCVENYISFVLDAFDDGEDSEDSD